MIIAIPTDDGNTVSEHFGHSKYFLLVDTEKKENNKLNENPHEKEENEAAGHGKLLKMLVENKVNEVICSNLNPRMEKNLSSLKIGIKKVESGSNIENLIN
ncbi:MAG: NifB/NifX family molybdenum-iron cluster-binding protein [Candidatus Acidifodinimicrobium sp.]